MQRIRLCPALQTEGQPRKRAPDHAVGLLEHGEQPKLPRLSDGDSDLQRGPERIGSLVPHAPGGGHATFRHAADDVCNSSVSAEGRPVGRTLSHDMTACIPPSPNASLGGFDGRARSRCGAHEERPLHLRSRMELLHAMQQLNESEVAIREELRVLRQGYEATMSSLKSATAMSSVSPHFYLICTNDPCLVSSRQQLQTFCAYAAGRPCRRYGPGWHVACRRCGEDCGRAAPLTALRISGPAATAAPSRNAHPAAARPPPGTASRQPGPSLPELPFRWRTCCSCAAAATAWVALRGFQRAL